VTALSEARDALTEWLPLAHAIIAIPDTSARTRASGRPGSRPPWNQANANAEMDTLATIADILARFRYDVTGHSGPRPPASATGRALDLIVSLGHAVPQHQARAAARDLAARAREIQQLPALDEIERPQRVEGVECRYCHISMLMTLPRAGIVYCKRGGFACWDTNGEPPIGRVTVGRLGPCVEWSDGLVT